MATQQIPISTGGHDANLKVGNILMLFTADLDRDEREAATAAARAYLEFPPRGQKIPAKAEKRSHKKKPGTAAPKPLPGVAQDIPTIVVLFPEIQIDSYERERSQAALLVWCSLTKRHALAVQWRAKMAAIGAANFKHPAQALAEASGRAEADERDEKIRAEVRRKKIEADIAATSAAQDSKGQAAIEQSADAADHGSAPVDDEGREIVTEILPDEENEGVRGEGSGVREQKQKKRQQQGNPEVNFTPEELEQLGLDKEFGVRAEKETAEIRGEG